VLRASTSRSSISSRERELVEVCLSICSCEKSMAAPPYQVDSDQASDFNAKDAKGFAKER
jgi:hypothetical protein